MTKKEIMISFYEAFTNGDFETMNSFYHKDVVFNDEIFHDLNYEQVTSMWKMLLDGNENMSVIFNAVDNEDEFMINWVADYTFGAKKRKVHNDCFSQMEIKDNKIIKHKDSFHFDVWAKQAIGLAGFFFGNAKWFRRKVSKSAIEKLENFINKK